MIVRRTASEAFIAIFESEDELREEHRTNLSAGALRLPSSETLPLDTRLTVMLVGPWDGEVSVVATVVALLPGALALAVDGDPEEMFGRLLAGAPDPDDEPTEESSAEAGDDAGHHADDDADRRQTAWDHIRGLSQMEKILLAVKAKRSERALLLQDNDPRVLLSLLRNPRLTVDEVARLAKSSFLTYQIADTIAKTSQWMAGLDVRLGLIHNPKTPPAIALAILPTLPDSALRAIARSGTNMALKQAALRRLQGR